MRETTKTTVTTLSLQAGEMEGTELQLLTRFFTSLSFMESSKEKEIFEKKTHNKP